MKLKLTGKLSLATLAVVAAIMAIFGSAMAHFLAADVRQRAQREGSEKIAQMLNALEIVDTLSSQNVRSALAVLVAEGQRLGDPEIKGTVKLGEKTLRDLRLGSSSLTGNFALVDHIKNMTGNTATLFVKDGDDFLRVSTNVLKPDGSRAIGTPLDRKGRAYAAVAAGQPFYGVVDILGSPYMTGYLPMKDKSARTVGVWYVGAPLATLADFGKQIAGARILDNGYLALSKADGSVIFKPELVRAQDIQARAGNSQLSGWVISSQAFEKWGYVLQAAYPESDIENRVRPLQLQIALGSLVMMILVVAVEYPLMKRLVLRPVQGLIDRLQSADINTSLEVDRSDEIGTLAAEFNQFVAKIRATLLRVVQASYQFANASEKFSAVSQQISVNSEETSAQATAVSSATEQVNRHLQTVATATEEMSASIQEIAKNATEAARVAAEAMKAAAQSNTSVSKLGDSSAEIGQVIKVITSIAQKTDLLALNATVEAARAGEAGAGFAVVADEVKELAKQTAEATEGISRKIVAIQADAKATVAAIKSIGEIIDQVNSISSTIATAVEEQSATATEMSRSLTEAAKGSDEVAHNIGGVAQAAQNTSHGATDSQRAARSLAEMSTQLRELVAQFNVHSNGNGAGLDSADENAATELAAVGVR